jgi:hypothetical protein
VQVDLPVRRFTRRFGAHVSRPYLPAASFAGGPAFAARIGPTLRAACPIPSGLAKSSGGTSTAIWIGEIAGWDKHGECRARAHHRRRPIWPRLIVFDFDFHVRQGASKLVATLV